MGNSYGFEGLKKKYSAQEKGSTLTSFSTAKCLLCMYVAAKGLKTTSLSVSPCRLDGTILREKNKQAIFPLISILLISDFIKVLQKLDLFS